MKPYQVGGMIVVTLGLAVWTVFQIAFGLLRLCWSLCWRLPAILVKRAFRP